MVTCAILYYFGTGPIRGFALTLGLGVLVSMFTAIVVTRTFLFALVNTNLGAQSRRVRRGRRGTNPRICTSCGTNGCGSVCPLAIIVPGLIAWGAGGIKQSIDFKGGTEQQIPFRRRATPRVRSQAWSASLGSKFKDSRVVVSEDPTQQFKHLATVTTERLDEPERLELLNTLVQRVGPLDKVERQAIGDHRCAVLQCQWNHQPGTDRERHPGRHRRLRLHRALSGRSASPSAASKKG